MHNLWGVSQGVKGVWSSLVHIKSLWMDWDRAGKKEKTWETITNGGGTKQMKRPKKLLDWEINITCDLGWGKWTCVDLKARYPNPSTHVHHCHSPSATMANLTFPCTLPQRTTPPALLWWIIVFVLLVLTGIMMATRPHLTSCRFLTSTLPQSKSQALTITLY